ncbi:MAG: DMT family transporter [Clostridiales bacterium]|nr:DMT family transporter [Clostridiales bacterium]
MGKVKTVLSVLVVMFLWGSLYPLIKLGYKAYQIKTVADTLLFAGIRFAISGGVLCVFALITRRKSFQTLKPNLLPIGLIGLFSIIMHYGFLYVGLQFTDSSKTSILKQVGALFFVCFSWLFFKDDKFNWKKLVGVLLGFTGVVATSFSSTGFLAFKIGDAMTIVASFCLVFGDIVSKKIAPSSDPMIVTSFSQLFGGVVLLVAGLVMGGKVTIGFNIDLWIIAYICFASIFSYTLWYSILRKGNLSKLFIIKFSVPIFSCIMGWLLLGEDILKWQYPIAFLLICAGIFISNLKNKKKSEPIQQEKTE